MRDIEVLSSDVSWQRGTVPPVTLEAGCVAVIVEGERVTGMGVGRDLGEAVRVAWTGRVVEA